MSCWLEVKAVLPDVPDDWAVFAAAFERHGLPGTVQTDRPPTISAYAARGGSELDLAALQDEMQSLGALKVETREVPEEDWAESWKQFFRPMRVGRHFVVCPSWEEYVSMPGDMLIVLDPGQAFGTGDHPTTRLCLELLESIGCAGLKVADIGCGSGILSIAAHLIGARSVTAVDIEAVSVETAIANVHRNGALATCHVGAGFEPVEDQCFDLVLSNIISAALIGLAPVARDRIRRDGCWIVSGVIEANWPDVLLAAEQAGFTCEKRRQEGDWIAAAFRR